MTAAVRRTKLAQAKTRVDELEEELDRVHKRTDLAYEAMGRDNAELRQRIAELEDGRIRELVAMRLETLRSVVRALEDEVLRQANDTAIELLRDLPGIVTDFALRRIC